MVSSARVPVPPVATEAGAISLVRLAHDQQVDRRILEFEDRRLVVLGDHLQAEDIGVERLRRREVLHEQGDDFEFVRCCDHISPLLVLG
jgi:hypothetical protein